jgi:polysaccharide deacetylase 2 family uncharacterized protein YibQ
VLGVCSVALAQAPKHKSFQSQASSTIVLSGQEGAETLEIRNVSYEVTAAFLPGRPQEERLTLRKTVRSKQVLDEMGMEATTTLEAWPFGADLKQKPVYTVSVSGADGRTMDGTLFVAERGLEEVEWWSAYKLGTGKHLLDTYVPLAGFSISREELKRRYIGLEVPPDDTADVRLKEARVVAVLTYASAERVIREALITCDDAQQAKLLRSYADSTREVSVSGTPASAVKISVSQNAPSPPATVVIQVPIKGDDLDLAHAQLPAKLHIAAWKR